MDQPKTSAEAAKIASLFWGNCRKPKEASRPPFRPRPQGATPQANFHNNLNHPSKPFKAEKKSWDKPVWDKEKGPRCFACDEYGHIAVACPKNPSPPGGIKSEEKSAPKFALAAQLADNPSPVPIAGSLNGVPVSNMVKDNGTNISVIDWPRTTRGRDQSESLPSREPSSIQQPW